MEREGSRVNGGAGKGGERASGSTWSGVGQGEGGVEVPDTTNQKLAESTLEGAAHDQ